MLNVTNRLWEAKDVAVSNIVYPQIESQGSGLPERRLRSRVKVVTAILYLVGEAYGHFPTTT